MRATGAAAAARRNFDRRRDGLRNFSRHEPANLSDDAIERAEVPAEAALPEEHHARRRESGEPELERMTLPGKAQIDRRDVMRREFGHDDPAQWHPQEEQREHERAPEARVETNPWPGERFENILNRADPTHRPAHESRARDGNADEREPKDASDDEPQRSGNMRFDEGKIYDDEEHLHESAAPLGRESVGDLRRSLHHNVDDTIAPTLARGRGSRGRRQYGE